MTGSLVHHGKNRWSLVFDLGTVTDPATGKKKRKQKWVTFHSTPTLTKREQRAEAQAKLTELLHDRQHGTFVEPSTLTLLDYLRTWLEKSIKPPIRRPETYRVYKSFIEGQIAKATIASLPLQHLRGSDLERFYADLTLAASSITVLHAVLHRALKKAVKDRLLMVNPAVDLERRRPSKDLSKGAREHCWSATEARRFIAAAKTASPQLAAFCLLALDTGARKSELHGLTWADLNLDAGTLTIERQLDKAGLTPVFGVTKTGRTRTVTLGAETVTSLRAHKSSQAALKLKNRTAYQDFGLIFAKEPEDLQTPEAQLGQPLNTLSESRFHTLVKAAGVKQIKFHGVRHTCATLLLQAGTPPHVVAQRLGHAKASMTLDVYAHATDDLQQDAATRLATLLHG